MLIGLYLEFLTYPDSFKSYVLNTDLEHIILSSVNTALPSVTVKSHSLSP